MESMLNREWRGAIVSVATDSTGVGFLRRKTNPFMERKENHMIIARAAKGAALLLMIFGVVAFIGCQAAAGAKGEPGAAGAKGEPGDAGAPGATGPAGHSALQAKGGGTYNILFNGTGDDADEIGDLTAPADGSLNLADAFVGGTPPMKYKATNLPSSGTFKVEVDEDTGMATISKRTASATDYATSDFTTGVSFTVTVTDANDISAQTTVEVKANRAPKLLDSHNPSTTHITEGRPGPGAHALHVILGTQPEIEAQGSVAKIAAVSKADTKGARVNNTISRGFGVKAFGAAGGSYMFEDDDPSEATLSIAELSATAAEHFSVEVDSDDAVLSFTGLKSTWNPDAGDNGEHKPVTFELVATDEAGLSAKGTIWVWVDGAPELPEDSVIPTSARARVSEGAGQRAITDVPAFFVDADASADWSQDPPTKAVLTVSNASSSNPAIATATVTGSNLEVEAKNPGTVTIRYLIGSDPEQSNLHNSATQALGLNRDGDSDVDGDDGNFSNTNNGVIPGLQYAIGTIQVTVIP